jgi:hypothetical protein
MINPKNEKIKENLNIFKNKLQTVHSKIHLHVKVFLGEKGLVVLFQSNPFGS